jgi:hypothetical protein
MGTERCTNGESIGGKARRERPLGRLERRWENNNKISVTEIRWGIMAWINAA